MKDKIALLIASSDGNVYLLDIAFREKELNRTYKHIITHSSDNACIGAF